MAWPQVLPVRLMEAEGGASQDWDCCWEPFLVKPTAYNKLAYVYILTLEQTAYISLWLYCL